MIVDSSAVLAIILDEPEKLGFAAALGRARAAKMSAAAYLEVALKVDRKHPDGLDPLLDPLLHEFGIALAPLTVEQGHLARVAFNRYGRGHKARLNFGDCLTYALAKATGEPLLFKGDDFIHTDLPRAGFAA